MPNSQSLNPSEELLMELEIRKTEAQARLVKDQVAARQALLKCLEATLDGERGVKNPGQAPHS